MRLLSRQPVLKFRSIQGAPHISPLTTIQRAQDVKPQWLKDQRHHAKADKFYNCPGMADLLTAGYIVPAWTDITIKANGAGTSVTMVHNEYMDGVSPMNPQLVQQIIGVDPDVKQQPMKLPAPWAVFAKKGYSAHVLPALLHAPFLRDLYVYPGTVDYDNFAVINFIFQALRRCELTIPAGTPLLQVIPFKRERMTASIGPATADEMAFHRFGFPTRVRAAYRKYFHHRKHYTIEGTAKCPFTSS